MQTSLPRPTPLLESARRALATDPARAVVLAREVLAAAPLAHEARLLLAAALRRNGDAAAAGTLLRPLAAQLAASWGVQYELGMALAICGNTAGAAAVLARSVTLNPRSTLAAHALGDQLALLGQHEAAAAVQARGLPGEVADPEFAAAAHAFLAGDATARLLLAQRYGVTPTDIAAVRMIAEVGLRSGRFEAVAALLASAVAAAPGYLPAQFAHAAALHRMQDEPAARAALLPVVAAHPDTTAVRLLHGAIKMALGQADAAVDDFEAARAATPGDAHAWHSLGHALRSLGRQREAVAAYRRAIVLVPAFGEAYWSIANLKTRRFEPSESEAMTRLLDDRGVGGADRGFLYFARAKAFEDEGHYTAAFDHYRQGNTARRIGVAYDSDAHQAFIERTIATFTPALLARHANSGQLADDPIFVLGMPRSGSTLVEQILSSHSVIEGLSELPELTSAARRLTEGGLYPERLASLTPGDFAALGQRYLDATAVRRQLPRHRFVDKFPGNFLHTGLIHLMLPRATIIDVRRDAIGCCLSLYKQAFAAGQAYSYDLTDLGHYWAGYHRLMGHFDEVLPGRIIRIDYAALVTDPEPQIRRLLAACGLDFEPACLDFHRTPRVIRTASSEQVRQPLSPAGLDHWRHFKPWLGPLIEALGPHAAHA